MHDEEEVQQLPAAGLTATLVQEARAMLARMPASEAEELIAALRDSSTFVSSQTSDRPTELLPGQPASPHASSYSSHKAQDAADSLRHVSISGFDGPVGEVVPSTVAATVKTAA